MARYFSYVPKYLPQVFTKIFNRSCHYGGKELTLSVDRELAITVTVGQHGADCERSLHALLVCAMLWLNTTTHASANSLSYTER